MLELWSWEIGFCVECLAINEGVGKATRKMISPGRFPYASSKRLRLDIFRNGLLSIESVDFLQWLVKQARAGILIQFKRRLLLHLWEQYHLQLLTWYRLNSFCPRRQWRLWGLSEILDELHWFLLILLGYRLSVRNWHEVVKLSLLTLVICTNYCNGVLEYGPLNLRRVKPDRINNRRYVFLLVWRHAFLHFFGIIYELVELMSHDSLFQTSIAGIHPVLGSIKLSKMHILRYVATIVAKVCVSCHISIFLY